MIAFEREAFIEYAVSKYSGMITRVAFAHTQNRSDADDICQDVLISLLDAPPFKTEEHMRAWLIRVSINRAKDLLKSRSRKTTVELNEAIVAIPDESEEVFTELESLSPDDRDIIYLFHYEGYNAKEIGKFLGCSERAVFTRLTRARARLKNILEED